jgi:hypothetical protein
MYSQLRPFFALRRLTLHVFACAAIIIVCHLQSRPLVSAFDVESLVRLAAVENAFVTSNSLRDEVKGLNELETEFLPLLIFCNCNIFDVADESEVMDAEAGSN